MTDGQADNQYDFFAELMEEPPGGFNHGRVATADGWDSLDGGTTDFLGEGGWIVVDTARGSGGGTYGAGDMGMTAHRGVLHSDEYVDTCELQFLVERNLGFTYAEISAAYDITGRPSAVQTEKRRRIDAALLGLSRSGGNLLELAKALDWPVERADANGGARCKKMERAVARAEKAERAEAEAA